MDDTISRRDAVEAMAELQGKAASKSELIGISKAWKRIKALPSAQQWIPWDSGKFPKESGTYTVTAYDGATKRVTYAKYQKRLKRWELTGARAYWRVLAWMEKPEPWKGDKHEAE